MWGRRRTWRNPSAAGGASALPQPALCPSECQFGNDPAPFLTNINRRMGVEYGTVRTVRPSARPCWLVVAAAARGGAVPDDWAVGDVQARNQLTIGRRNRRFIQDARAPRGRDVGRSAASGRARPASGRNTGLPVPPPGDAPPIRLKPIYPHPPNRVRLWCSGEFGGAPKGHSRAARVRAESGVAADRCAADSTDTKGVARVRSGVCR